VVTSLSASSHLATAPRVPPAWSPTSSCRESPVPYARSFGRGFAGNVRVLRRFLVRTGGKWQALRPTSGEPGLHRLGEAPQQNSRTQAPPPSSPREPPSEQPRTELTHTELNHLQRSLRTELDKRTALDRTSTAPEQPQKDSIASRERGAIKEGINVEDSVWVEI